MSVDVKSKPSGFSTTLKTIKPYVMVILGTIIYSFGISWVLQLIGIVSSGITGISQLIVGVIGKYVEGAHSADRFTGVLILLINVPLIAFGWRGVSKKFAILTTVSVVFQFIFVTLLNTFTLSPLVFLLGGGEEVVLMGANEETFKFVYGVAADENGALKNGFLDVINSGQFNIFWDPNQISAIKQGFANNVGIGEKVLLAFVGGLITGFGLAFALKNGGSTGGMDIISNYLAKAKRINFTKLSSIVDSTIIGLSSLLSVEGMLLAIIRIVVSIKTIDQLYASYKITRLEIITTKAKEISAELMSKFTHSVTYHDAIGAYTNSQRQVMMVCVSKYEVEEYINIVKRIDPDAFIVTAKVKVLRSNFVQRSM